MDSGGTGSGKPLAHPASNPTVALLGSVHSCLRPSHRRRLVFIVRGRMGGYMGNVSIWMFGGVDCTDCPSEPLRFSAVERSQKFSQTPRLQRAS